MNTFIGTNAGELKMSGWQNTFLGTGSGQDNGDGSGNTFIGYLAGANEQGSNKLYIENSASTSPLIYGEFDNNKVQINGNLHISETAKLIPLTTVPGCTISDKGLLYVDDNANKLRFCDGIQWVDLN